jgi:peroxiredoxin
MAAHRQRTLLPAGSTAPDFRLARLEGGEMALAEILAGGPALLVFYKITCPVCQMALPFLERIHAAANGAAQRLPVYGISQNDAEDTREFMREFGVTFPMLLDREEDGFPASNAYGISSVPTSFLVERDGAVARVIEGWQKAEIERLGSLAGVAVLRASDSVPAWKAG